MDWVGVFQFRRGFGKVVNGSKWANENQLKLFFVGLKLILIKLLRFYYKCIMSINGIDF